MLHDPEALPENRHELTYLRKTLEKNLGLVGVLYVLVSLRHPRPWYFRVMSRS
jgi:hypothetical protein